MYMVTIYGNERINSQIVRYLSAIHFRKIRCLTGGRFTEVWDTRLEPLPFFSRQVPYCCTAIKLGLFACSISLPFQKYWTTLGNQYTCLQFHVQCMLTHGCYSVVHVWVKRLCFRNIPSAIIIFKKKLLIKWPFYKYQQQKCPVKPRTSRLCCFCDLSLKMKCFLFHLKCHLGLCVYIPMVKFPFGRDCQASMQAGSYDVQCHEYISHYTCRPGLWNVNTAAPCLGALCLVWCKTNTRTCSGLKQYHCRERIRNEICRLIYIYNYFYWFLPLSASLPCF